MSYENGRTKHDLKETFDWMADRYVDQTTRVSRGMYRWWMDQIADIIRGWNPRSVADVGCGPGYLLRKLQEALPDAELVGVDFSERMLDRVPDSISKEHQPLSDWATSSDKTYDVLVMTFVLRDQPDPTRSLREIRSRLKPDGHLLILETQTPRGWKGPGFKLYFHHWLPWWGRHGLTRDWPGDREAAPYQWLSDTHRAWSDGKPLPKAFEDSGYETVEHHRPDTDVVMLWSAKPAGG